MPDWIVQAVNTSALVGFCLFTMWATISIARFMKPYLVRYFEDYHLLVKALIADQKAKGDQLNTIEHKIDSLAERSIAVVVDEGGKPVGLGTA